MRGRAVLLGLLALAGAWIGPLPALARETFIAHMTMHVSVVAVAAPLLALGLAQSRFDPVRARPRWFAPVPGAVLEFIVIWAWHAPALHDAARSSTAALAAEQGSFLTVALLLWLGALGGESARGGERAGAGIIGLLLTSMHMTLLGALLSLAQRPLYGHHDGGFGLTALEDQQLGGVVMLIGGGSVYLAGSLYLLIRLLRAGAPTRAAGQNSKPL